MLPQLRKTSRPKLKTNQQQISTLMFFSNKQYTKKQHQQQQLEWNRKRKSQKQDFDSKRFVEKSPSK